MTRFIEPTGSPHASQEPDRVPTAASAADGGAEAGVEAVSVPLRVLSVTTGPVGDDTVHLVDVTAAELRYWAQVKYLTVVLTAMSGVAGIIYVLLTPTALNAGSVLVACGALVGISLLFLTVPTVHSGADGTRPVVYGIWASTLVAIAVVLARFDTGLYSPFFMLLVVGIVLAGAAASRGYVIATGVIALAGFVWLHAAFGFPVGGGSVFAGAMLVLVMVAAGWVAATQERRARLLVSMAGDLADQAVDLAEQTASFRWVMEATPTGICVSDAEDRITLVNLAACQMSGLSMEELIGAPAHETFHPKHADGSPFPKEECDAQMALRSRLPHPLSRDVYWRADDTPYDVEANAVPTPDGGVMVAFTDISERLATQRLKDEFMSVISHELRTPLTSVRGALGLLAGGAAGELPPQVTNMVAIAASNTDRLSRLINDILDVERIGSGKAVLRLEVVDANAVVLAAVEEMRVMATEHGVDLRTVGDAVNVDADCDRVHQVVVNLLSNAIKFSDSGSEVVVAIAVDGGEARIDVSDRGRGIPDAHLGQVFNRFLQVDASDARVMGGAGLGLAICDGIVRQHGGRIWVDSTVGVGSTFSFTLPLAKVAATRAERDGRVVLVIDGDSGPRHRISQALDTGGYRPLVAATGRRGLEMAASERPAVVLIDADLPDMDAWEVVRNLREQPDTSTVAIVLFGDITAADKTELGDAVDAFIDLTTIHATLLPAVDSALRNRAADPIVLIVEDDVDLAEVLLAAFKGRGVETAVADTCAAARAVCEQSPPDVIMLDLVLPDGSGADFLAWLDESGDNNATEVVIYTALDVDPWHRVEMGVARGNLFTKSQTAPAVVVDRILELLDVATPTSVTGRNGTPTMVSSSTATGSAGPFAP